MANQLLKMFGNFNNVFEFNRCWRLGPRRKLRDYSIRQRRTGKDARTSMDEQLNLENADLMFFVASILDDDLSEEFALNADIRRIRIE